MKRIEDRFGVLRRDKGFSLLEVLIAVVILGVGLLGLGGLQSIGLQQNHGAYLRTQAVIGADDILDRMRANRSNLASYAADWDDWDDPTENAANQAERDLQEWKVLLADYLPGGNGAVVLDGSRVTVTVRWDDQRQGGDEDDWVTLTIRTEV